MALFTISMARTRVLLVEDSPGDIELTRALLNRGAPGTFDLVFATSLAEAVERLRCASFDVVLLDLALPDSDRIETLQKILELAPEVPVVVLTGFDDVHLAVLAVREGAQEYVLKGSIDERQLVVTIRSAILRKQTELRLARRAFYDDLTDLPTRALLQDRWDRARNRQRRSGTWMAILMVDLDELKAINDTYGHLAGDQVLVTLTRRVEGLLRRGDTMARIGGDEFVVLLEQVHGMEDAELIVGKIHDAMAEAIALGDTAIQASASVGAAICHPDKPDSLYEVVRRADLDMYNRKGQRDRGAERFLRVAAKREPGAPPTDVATG